MENEVYQLWVLAPVYNKGFVGRQTDAPCAWKMLEFYEDKEEALAAGQAWPGARWWRVVKVPEVLSESAGPSR